MKQENLAAAVEGAVKSRTEFDADLAQMSIRGEWRYDAILETLIGGPKPSGVPHIWQWKDIHPKLLESCTVFPQSNTARRHLSFINPGLELMKGGTTHTMVTGMQMVLPGETAWAHRHAISALRFGVESDGGLYTNVDGEAFPMEPNDLVLTPAWSWHDHHNDSKKPGVWLDVLDLPMMLAMNQLAYEPYGKSTQQLRPHEGQYVSERVGDMRPMWEQPPAAAFPYRYAWRDVQAQLHKMAKAQGSPYDGIILGYTNPVNGGPTLPSLQCCMQWLKPGFAGEKHRRTASTLYYVVEGEGRSIVGDTELHWGPRDVFAIPNWMWHQHLNASKSSDAVLFSVSDAPLLEALHLYREEPARTWRRSSPPPVPPRATS